MKYQKVSKEEAEKIKQELYEFMPVFGTFNGEFGRVVAQGAGVVYYVIE